MFCMQGIQNNIIMVISILLLLPFILYHIAYVWYNDCQAYI